MHKARKQPILVADPAPHTRQLVADVLRSAGFEYIIHASDGETLLNLTVEYDPHIVITTSRLPRVSGLEFTRALRAGFKSVSRETRIIVMTDTPTEAFLAAARDSGVDEMLVRPFTLQAVLDRVEAVLERPREFVDSAVYIGPCRRRRGASNYKGPMRRFLDPLEDEDDSDQPLDVAPSANFLSRP